MKKRCIGILLCLGLLLGLIPFSATPAGAATFNGLILPENPGDSWPTASEADDMNTRGYHWRGGNVRTLTIRSLSGTGSIRIEEPNIKLEVLGTNTITYGPDGGVNLAVPGGLTITGGGTLALTAAGAGSGTGVKVSDGSAEITGGTTVTVNHRAATDIYAFRLESADNICSLHINSGSKLTAEGGGVVAPGKLLIDGAGSYVYVTATTQGAILDGSAMCGMLEITGGGELCVNDANPNNKTTGLVSMGNYNETNPAKKSAVYVDGGTLYAAGSYLGADVWGNVIIKNKSRVAFNGGGYNLLGSGGALITGSLSLDKDCYFATAGTSSILGFGLALCLKGGFATNGDKPDSSQVIKGSYSSSATQDLSVLDGVDFTDGVWLGLATGGWAYNGARNSLFSLLRRLKIEPRLEAGPSPVYVHMDEADDSKIMKVGQDIVPVPFTVTGGAAPYTFKIDGPKWLRLELNPVTGQYEFKGTPDAPSGKTVAMVTVTDSDGYLANWLAPSMLRTCTPANTTNPSPIVIYLGDVIGDPLAFADNFSVPESVVDVKIAPPVDVHTGASGGTPPYAFSIDYDHAPSWLTITPTGEISGTPPKAAAETAARIYVTDSAVPPASAYIDIPVGEARAPLVFDNYGWGVPNSETEKPIAEVDVSAGVSGGTGGYTYSLSEHPTWLSIDNAGKIKGTPPSTVQPETTAKITVTDSSGNSDFITITVGEVFKAQVTSDLTFFHYPEFDVPRTYPGKDITQPLNLGSGYTCSVKPVDINVSSGVSGGTKPYTFEMVSGPTWLHIVSSGANAGKLYGTTPGNDNTATSTATPANNNGNVAATKAVIRVTDSAIPPNRKEMEIKVGPVSSLRFNNNLPGWNQALMTGTNISVNPIGHYTENNNSLGTSYYGYHVTAGYPGTPVYESAGSATEKPSGSTGPGWQHPHYGMTGGQQVRSGTNVSNNYDFDIVNGPIWLDTSLNGCFSGSYTSYDANGLPTSAPTTSSNYQYGIRPPGPRPATTVTIQFEDKNGALEIITLPVGPIIPKDTDMPLPFTFTKLASYDIDKRLVGTPLPDDPPINFSRTVVGASSVSFTMDVNVPSGYTGTAADWDWLQLTPEVVNGVPTGRLTGELTGTPPMGKALPATTATITAINDVSPFETRTIQIQIGAVYTNYLRFEKPASWAGDIPAGGIGTAIDLVYCAVCASGGETPYTYRIAFDGTDQAKWSWLSIGLNDGIITGTRPATALPENIARVTVRDAAGVERSIAVTIGAVISSPLVFVDSPGYDIPEGLIGSDILPAINVSGAVSGGTGAGTYRFTKTGGPDWVNVSTDGVITGTRPGAATGATTAEVTVTDGNGKTNKITIAVGAVYTVKPTELAFTDKSFAIPEGTVGKAIATIPLSAYGTVSGGVPGYTFSIIGPAWLKINQSNGTLSGTPDASSSAKTATVTVTDSAGASKSIQITVGLVRAPVPLRFDKQADYDFPATTIGDSAVTVGSLVTLDGGVTAVKGVVGGTPPYTFSINAAIPAGSPSTDWDWLKDGFSTSTGQITAAPDDVRRARPATEATVTVRDSTGKTASVVISIGAVAAAPLVFAPTGYSVPPLNTGANFSADLAAYGTVTGGTPPYSYSISGSAWLKIDRDTGVISGMPLDATTGDTSATVTVRDNADKTASITITVGKVTGDPILRLTDKSFVIKARVVNTAVSPTLDLSYGNGFTGGVGPYTYSISMANGKTWLSVGGTTGIVSGTPGPADDSEATTATVIVRDSKGKTLAIPISVGAVTKKLDAIESYTIPENTKGKAIAPLNVYLGVTGGTKPYTFTMAVGENLSWLHIDPETGVITGTPDRRLTETTVQVKVTDSADPPGSPAYIRVTVKQVIEPMTFIPRTTDKIPDGTAGVKITPLDLGADPPRVNYAIGAYTYSITMANGQTWLSIDPITGIITGTPPAAASATIAYVKVTDSAVPPNIVEKPIPVGEVKASLVPIPLKFDQPNAIPAGMVNTSVSVNISGYVVGDNTPYTYSLSGPASSWLSIVSSGPDAGKITGTRTTVNSATSSVTVTVTDSAGASMSRTITVGPVNPAPTGRPLAFNKLSGFDIPAGVAGTPIASVNVSGGVSDGTPPYTFAMTGHPTWLSIVPSGPDAGKISGTPPVKAAAINNVVITVTDSASPTKASKSITISIGAMDAPAPALAAPPAGSVTIAGGEEGSDITPVSVVITGGTAPYTYSITPDWLKIDSTGRITGTRPAGASAAFDATVTVTDARGASVSFKVKIGAVTAKKSTKYIFTTKWLSNFGNWLLFIFLFGWIWMWFVNPKA